MQGHNISLLVFLSLYLRGWVPELKQKLKIKHGSRAGDEGVSGTQTVSYICLMDIRDEDEIYEEIRESISSEITAERGPHGTPY